MAGPLGVSLAPYIRSSPTLAKLFTPVAKWYAGGSLYRQYGLLYDDLCSSRGFSVRRTSLTSPTVIEERPEVQKVPRNSLFAPAVLPLRIRLSVA
jgi:hypothetical protein